MNITVKKPDLVYITDLAQQITKEKSPLPVLSNILITADENGATYMSASNMDVTLKSKCASVIE